MNSGSISIARSFTSRAKERVKRKAAIKTVLNMLK